MPRLRVCVIGAGAAGLSAARHLTSELDAFDVRVFEQSSCIGGTWVFTEDTGVDERGIPVHSSVYRNLRTNLPKEVMAFPDFPFPLEWSSFLSHQQVLRYLQDYASHFDLYKFIQFNSSISSVRPLMGKDSQKPMWEVVVTDADTIKELQQVLLFDAVIVCNGHFAVPRLPVIPHLESFPGLVMHSHNYRHPEVFQGKHLVIFGSGPSGVDICLDVANCAEKVYFSHKNTFCSKLPENVEQHRPIMSICMDGTVMFEDGQERKVDSILLCTGYMISFPFLHDDCSILVRNNRVTHLYKHIFNTKYPTLSFIGLCSKNFCTCPRFSLQAQYIASVLSGRKSLPSEGQMNADEEQDFQERLSLGMPEHHAHIIGTRGDYDGMIAQLAGVDRLSPVYHSLFDYVTEERFPYHLMHYKKDNFRVNSDGTWSLVKNLADYDNSNRGERNAESHMDSLQNGLEPLHKRLDHQKTKH